MYTSTLRVSVLTFILSAFFFGQPFMCAAQDEPEDMTWLMDAPVSKQPQPVRPGAPDATGPRDSLSAEEAAFVEVPPGMFSMGSPVSDTNRASDEEPQREIRFAHSILVSRYEVTQQLWVSIMGNNPSALPHGPNYPVNNVTWRDCQDFLGRLNARSDVRFRLPTEAEWEYACRAGAETPWHFGNDPTQLGEFAWYADNSAGQIHEVGKKKPNAWGLHDMHGNVYEWCQDSYEANYANRGSDGHRAMEGGESRVRRGGSYNQPAKYCRNAFRGNGDEKNARSDVGLRLVADVPQGQARLGGGDTGRGIAPAMAVRSPDESWFVILGSFPESRRSAAEELLAELNKHGDAVQLLNTSDYPNLADGYWAIVKGPYDKDRASVVRREMVANVPEAYMKSGW